MARERTADPTCTLQHGRRLGGLPIRLFTLRCILIVAVVFGVLASWRLWLTTRLFPLVPVAAWFPRLSTPWDAILLGLLLLSLFASIRYYRPATAFFLLGGLFLYGADQNRGQPWFYLYCVLLLLTMLPNGTALAACRIVISAVYVWAAIQKLGPGYQHLVVPYMTEPLARWLPEPGVAAARWCLSAAPAIELFVGVGLWIPRLRRAAIIATAIVHGIALLLLGPMGHNYNLVVWPWNLAMIVFVIVLFPPVRLVETLRTLRHSAIAMIAVALVTLLPVLGYFGWWDSYFSFALYSGNTAAADMIIVPSLVERLPAPMRRFGHPLHADVVAANPALRGLFVFDMQSWAQAELGVPPIPEPRNYRAIGRFVAGFAERSTDVQLVVSPRRGPVQVYRADQLH